MLKLLSKSISSSNSSLQLYKLYSTSSIKAKKPIFIQNGNQESFTAQYLMNNCGLSMEKAVSYSSKYIRFDNNDKPDSVIAFFKNQGFTESQIRSLVSIHPRILSANLETTLLPKIQFFRSKGFLGKDLVRVIRVIPVIFKRSLEKFIVPSFDFIKDFIGSEKDAISAISTCAKILIDLEYAVKPNIQILLGAGMSRSTIAYFLKIRPFVFVNDSDRLRESVKRIGDMGMDPKSYRYGSALVILTITRRSTWNKRMEAFRRWGCSEDDVLRSFTKSPAIMIVSEEKLDGIMRLFVHEMGWESSEVVKRYFMFTMSLKRRMIPRWSVYKELVSKGLVEKDVNINTLFQMNEDLFLKKFVKCYKIEAPFLLKLYKEKQASK